MLEIVMKLGLSQLVRDWVQRLVRHFIRAIRVE